MRFSLLVASRILSGVRHPYLSVVSKITILGVALGVSALVVVFSISEGFSHAFQDKILSLYPHMVVLRRGTDFRDHAELADTIVSIKGIAEAIPATYDELMVVHQDRRGQVLLKGLPLNHEGLRQRLQGALMDGGSLSDISPEIQVRVDKQDAKVSLSGGVSGIISQIAIFEGVEGDIQVKQRSPLWVRPSAGWGRVGFVAPGQTTLLCMVGAMEYSFKIPESGGFTQAMNLREGNHLCRVDPQDGNQDPVKIFDLRVRSGEVQTMVLNMEGLPGKVGAVVEEPNPNSVASGTRIYWPAASAFSLVTPTGETHKVEGAVSPWITMKNLPAPGVLLGKTVANRLRAGIGDELRLMTPLRGIDGSSLGPIGMAPTSLKVKVQGILHTGFHEFDNRFAITDLRAVQRFFNRGDDVRWVEIRIKDVERTQEMVDSVTRKLDSFGLPDLLLALVEGAKDFKRLSDGTVSQLSQTEPAGAVGYLGQSAKAGQLLRTTAVNMVPDKEFRVIDWRRMNRNLLSAIRLQRVVLTIFFLIITLVAASNVVGNQIMLIHEKTRTIAILRAMGASRRQVFWVFRVQGLITTSVGAFIGAVLGYGVCWCLRTFPLPLNAEIYFIESLPMDLNLTAVAIVVGATLLGTWFATTFSARRAAQIVPVAGLHHVD